MTLRSRGMAATLALGLVLTSGPLSVQAQSGVREVAASEDVLVTLRSWKCDTTRPLADPGAGHDLG